MLELRRLNDGDIPLVENWLNREHVKRWYEIPRQGVFIDDWIYEFKERGGEFQWLTHLIVLSLGRPIGLCQYYRCEDSRDEDFGTMPIAGSYGIDYLIGEEAYLGKGLGKEMVTLLVRRVFSFPDAERITADIDKENTASKKTLLSCGFSPLDATSSRYVLYQKQADESLKNVHAPEGVAQLKQKNPRTEKVRGFFCFVKIIHTLPQPEGTRPGWRFRTPPPGRSPGGSPR